MHAVRWMTHTNITAKYGSVAIKNTVRSLCEEFYLVVLIHKSYINW